LHPQGVPIFPTEFSVEKLERFRKRLGTYYFSCQFLNEPVNPIDATFRTEWLRYFSLYKDNNQYRTEVDGVTGEIQKIHKVMIQHNTHEGNVIADQNPGKLRRVMIIDPNHSGNDGRCRSAITVTGINDRPRRIYLLDVWAELASPETFIETIFDMALRWKVQDIYLETIAAQKYLYYHLKTLMPRKREENEFFKTIKFHELKTPKTANAKQIRIESLSPIFERGEFWVCEVGQTEFLEEYKSFPSGRLKDVLDTLGYGPQVWDKATPPGNVKNILEKRYKEYQELSARS
jgi:hypothetical protein